MYLYLVVSESTVSGSLVREEEGAQKAVYYVSHIMNGPQTRYQRLKKLVFALFIIAKKLKHYFQTFSITALTKHPLKSIMKNLKAMVRISKWASDLKSYRLKYEPRTAIKGQVLTDFIAKFILGITGHTDQLDGWVLNVDRASNSKGQESESFSGEIHHRAVLHPRVPRIQQWIRI